MTSQHQHTHHHTAGREKWKTKIGLILAMAGSAVGLGNFLRFPVQCVQNGGGAFMIPYFVALFLLGIPLMWIEWGIGRFGGKYGHGTTPGMFFYLWHNRAAKYLGAIGIAIPLCLVVYYTYIESWTLAYAFFSATGKYFGITEHAEMAKFISSFQGKVSNSYFRGINSAYLFFLITLVLNVFVLSKGLVKGIERFAKIFMPVLFVFAVILLIRVLTLGTPDPAYPERNVINGFGFVWNPDFTKLTDMKIWLAAAGQVFFTLSVGFGAIQTYASYLTTKDDIVLSGLTTSMTNEFAEIIFGSSIAITVAVAFFGIIGTQQVANGGAFDLGFMAMPIIFQKMPFGELMGLLWFGLLFLAGVTSSISMCQPLMAFLQDEFKVPRKTAALLLGGALFFLGQPVIFFLKYGFLDEMDFWIGTFGIVVFAIIEIIIFVWIHGSRKAWREINQGRRIKIPKVFYFIIRFITPAYLFILLVAWFWQNGIDVILMKGVLPENKMFIWFARFMMLGVFAFMVFLVRIAWQKKHKIGGVVSK